MSDKIEAPAYSVGEASDGKISVRVDGGTFMDTCYNYETIDADSNGFISYSIKILTLVINGLTRDEMQLRHQEPERIQELHDAVCTPILEEMLEAAKQAGAEG